MKIAVMQPYLYPYIGYFQLISKVDTFVFFDDVNFIKKGWINRNRLLGNNGEFMFSIPLIKASQNKQIVETFISHDTDWQEKLLKSYDIAYSKTLNYKLIRQLLKEDFEKTNTIADYAESSIRSVCKLLDLRPKFLRSVDIEYDRSGKGEDKILSICSQLGGTIYVNPEGGRDLYNPDKFKRAGIELVFNQSVIARYEQENRDFIGGLSIIDILARNPLESVKEMLEAPIS